MVQFWKFEIGKSACCRRWYAFTDCTSFFREMHISSETYSENQTEINTGVNESIEAAIEELKGHTRRIQEKLKALSRARIAVAIF